MMQHVRLLALPGMVIVAILLAVEGSNGGDREQLQIVLPRDAIPAINKPQFATRAEADKFLDDNEPVIGLADHGEARAYSTWLLDRHEIVNDSFGNRPIAVTW